MPSINHFANRIRRYRRGVSYRALVREGVVQIGRHTYGTPIVHSWVSVDGRMRQGGRVVIGSFTSMAADVQILTGGEHITSRVTTSPLRNLLDLPGVDTDGHPATKGDVEIGNDVWIGTEAMILSGVRIGDGAVIGARALVSADVEPYAVVAGNPARLVRYRFEPDVIAALLRLRWWEWSDEVIAERADLLLSDRVQELLQTLDA